MNARLTNVSQGVSRRHFTRVESRNIACSIVMHLNLRPTWTPTGAKQSGDILSLAGYHPAQLSTRAPRKLWRQVHSGCISRRNINLASAGTPLALFGQQSNARKASRLVTSGMDKFRRADVNGSLEDFDSAMALDPQLRPYLWQRGLSLYYAEQYREAAQQFRDDVAVNPSDTEEAIWAFLAEARLLGPMAARAQFLQVGVDPRPVLRAAYAAFQEGSKPERILAAADPMKGSRDTFYANLYVGLYHESMDDEAAAERALINAVQTPYAQQSGDYMAALAAVHCLRRGYSTQPAAS